MLVIDPGEDLFKIIERVEFHGAAVSGLWHTHAHLDHIGATKNLWEWAVTWNEDKGMAPPPVWLHEADRWLYDNVAIQAGALGLPSVEVLANFSPISTGDLPNHEGYKVLHTPGHTPGSCCLKLKKSADLHAPKSFVSSSQATAAGVLFSGDTLFKRSIGRTDLWGGNLEQLVKSIRGNLWGLAEDTVVVPGHGPFTTIGEEKEKNPFVGAAR